jgi:hypothetical protein
MTTANSIEIEGKLAFEFQKPTWVAVKWDTETGYQNGLRRIDASAVDILATMHQSTVCMIEVKDPRGYRIEYRNSNPVEKLAATIADKVRDTIAGIVYARDRHPGDHLHIHLKTVFQERVSRPLVVLWLEGIEVQPALATTLTSLIEKKLVWLKPKVLVTSRALWRGMAGLAVHSLAGAPWTG